MKKRTLELKNVEINDDFPIYISLCGKSILRYENGKCVNVRLLDRREDNYLISNISSTELKPSIDKDKLLVILKYFFSVCDVSVSPQSLWETSDCSYNSLMLNYEIDNKKQFENVLDKITKQFPELKREEKFLEKIPKGKVLLDVVSEIEVAYPRTWNIDYIVK